MSWYKQGTINLANGDSTVTGNGTKWAVNLRVGDGLQAPDGKLYEVTNIASDTTLSIFPSYSGTTAENKNYWIVPIQGYIKLLADRAARAIDEIDGVLVDADRAEAAADAADASASASASQANRSEIEANRSELEANRAEGEADRAQQAADDAVAVVSGGEASIDPEPGKIPIAGAEGTIKQAWVHELEFALDKLRVATNKALYGDGPYPVLDFQFQGANMLDPRIEFTRASKGWDSQGREYGIDEPVLTDEGLWVSGARTNLVRWGSDITKWSPARVDFIGGFVVPTDFDSTHSVAQTINIDEGKVYTFSAIFETDGSLPVCRIHTLPESGTSGVFLDTRDLSVRMAGLGDLESSADIQKIGAVYLVKLTFRSAMSGGLSLRLSATPTNLSSNFVGDGISKFRYSEIQFEEGIDRTPYIPTEGSQVTVAMTLPSYQNMAPSLRFPHLTLLASGKIKGRGDGLTGANSRRHVFFLRGKTGNERVYIYFENRASDIALGVVTYSTGGVVSTFTHSSLQDLPEGRFKVGVRIQQNGVSVTFNGVSRFFNASFESVLGDVELGRSGTDRFLLGYLDCFVLFKEHLTDQQLEELTS